MAFQLPGPIPNFNTQPNNHGYDPLAQQGQLATLSQMLSANKLQQALAPQQIQQAQQTTQLQQLEIQKQQMALKSQKAIAAAWADPDFVKKISVPSQDGGMSFDPNVMTTELIARGGQPSDVIAQTQEWVKRDQAIAATQKDVAQTGTANADVRQKTLKEVGDALGAIQSKTVDKAQDALDAFKQKLIRDPKAFPGLTQDEMSHLYGMDLTHLGSAGGMLQLEAAMNEFHKGEAEKTKAQQGVIPSTGGLSPEAQQQVGKDVAVATNPQIQQGKVAVATAEGKARAEAQASLLQGTALDQSAQRYLMTGQLPAGMRSPGMSAAIINRAGELGAGQNIAANTAGYTANKASYENVTKTLDTLSGFESAAVKNIDMFKSLASKLPDTGVPWINKPLRLLDEKAVGAEWMPAINAAREIANREVARVTNDPKLAGVLSDSARQEVASINPKDATFAQMMHVTDLMKQDMANVHSSLAMQKADIGKRLGMQPSAEQPQANTAGHVIAIGDKNYQYKGSGDTADLKNYTEVKKP